MKEDILRRQALANMWMGVGLLLVIVPMGISLLSIIADPRDPFHEARLLGWAFYVVMALLPVGIGACIWAFSWMALLKKELATVDDEEEEEERAKMSARPSSPGGRPDLTPPKSDQDH